MLTIAVVNLKGGSTKTTSAAFLLHALAESGLAVLGVDSDPENESLLSWSEIGEWSVPVIGMPVANLHRQLPGIVSGRYDAVVIDTPPMKESRGIVSSAVRLASHVVVPVAPTPMEFDRLSAVRELVDDVAPLRESGQAPALAVLFTRVVASAASTEVFRELIAEQGERVLTAQVGRLERFSQAYGSPITNALNTAYGDALTELLKDEDDR